MRSNETNNYENKEFRLLKRMIVKAQEESLISGHHHNSQNLWIATRQTQVEYTVGSDRAD